MSYTVLELDAFIRKIGINKTTKHSVFLGAGASISSGIPSAESCIWEWKRSIFLSKNPGLEHQFSELTLESVRQKIQKWLNNQSEFPKLRDIEEYSFYIERCYQTHDDRRKYFQEKIIKAKPHTGYNLLCLLAESGLIQTIYTTNFDGLIMRAASNFALTTLEIGIDSQNRLNRTLTIDELLCISLHGDYRYDDLKNTLIEIQNQEKNLSDHLVETTKDISLIVCGYSGLWWIRLFRVGNGSN
jgi:NAD-dependent SIR2 family protein deacetylase